MGSITSMLQNFHISNVYYVSTFGWSCFLKYKSLRMLFISIFFRWRSPFHAHLWEFHRPNSNKWPFTVSWGQASEFSEWHKGHRRVSFETKEAPLCSENFIEILLCWIAYCVNWYRKSKVFYLFTSMMNAHQLLIL